MYNKIESILLRYGYESIQLNIEGIHLALRQDNGEGYAFVTLDETTGMTLSRDQFYHISEQIRNFIQRRNCYHTHFLYLLISEDDESVERLFCNHECFWRMIISRGTLMVYETKEPSFEVLRAPIENLLTKNKGQTNQQRNYEQNTYQNYGNAAGYENYNGYTDMYENPLEREVHQYFSNGIQGIRERIQYYSQKGRIPWCNLVIILVNVLMFLATEYLAVTKGEDIATAGAVGWYEVLEKGQWYRVITSMFLHGGIRHIFNNMLILGYVGSCVEIQMGSLKYGIMYLMSGILAGGTSMVYNMLQNEHVISVGASGAIFGVVGAMLFLVFSKKGRMGQYNGRQIALMAFLSLYGGFASEGVDNAAHVGGFVAGFLLTGLLMIMTKNEYSNR